VRHFPIYRDGGFLESRGLWDFSDTFRLAAEAMQDHDGSFAASYPTRGGQVQLLVEDVVCLSIVPPDKAEGPPA
jgi:hypothetical protein